MPYTNTWDETTPSGGSQLSGGDNAIRQLKADLRERFEDFLVDDWDADPIVLKESVSGAGDHELFLHWSAFDWPVQSGLDRDDQYMQDDTAFAADRVAVAPINLPIGSTITEVVVVCDNNGAAQQWGMRLRRVDVATGAIADVFADVVEADAGIQHLTSGTISHEVAADFFYLLRAALPGTPGRLYGAIIRYTVA